MEVLTVKELAMYLRCSESKIRNLVRDNAIPNFRIGAKINFNKEAINNWIKLQEQKNNQKTSINQNKIISIKEAIGNVV